MIPKIEIFVAGAQHCGTIALSNLLSQHPQLQMGARTEAQRFDNDQLDWEAESIETLINQGYSSDARRRVDSNPQYLYWPKSIQRIAKYNPDAKIIVVLRDPIERAYFHWKKERESGREQLDFSTAIRVGRNRFDRYHRVFSYVEGGLYAEQLARVYRHFTASQVLVLSHQELLNHPADTLDRVSDFLCCERHTLVPASKEHSSADDIESMLPADRRYLELVYREPNQQLLALCGIDFRRTEIKPENREISFCIADGFPQIDGLWDLPHDVSKTLLLTESARTQWFPYLVSENTLNPYLPKILKLLALKKEPTTYPNTYGILGKFITNHLQKWNQKQKLAVDNIVLMFPTDMEYPYEVPDSVICLRTSLVQYKRRPLDLAMPLPQLTWEPAPPPTENKSVGFCGVPNHPSRKRLLLALQQQTAIPSHFIFRDRFWGRIREQSTPEQLKVLRREYEDSLADNLFVVCSRGAGNYSIRFYETLRAGRIPVMLDTAMVFPLEELVDYSEFVICEPTPDLVLDRMLDWIENRDVRAIQKRCREVWENYLYFPRYLEHLPSLLSKLIDVG